jgi:hypothetical protein
VRAGVNMAAISRMVMQYLLLVGLPVVGIATALQAGAKVQAPPDVSGRWVVTAISRGTVPGSCLASVGRDGPIPLRIRQSGGYLSARMRGWNGHASGRIEGFRITIDWPDAQETACVNALRVDARLEEQPGGDRTLTGTMRIPGCLECGVASFVAEKRQAAIIPREVE